MPNFLFPTTIRLDPFAHVDLKGLKTTKPLDNQEVLF